MKRVIGGKLYDTEKASSLGSRSSGRPSDFEHMEESLYRSVKGAFFLAGEGGPRSKYGEQRGRDLYSGEGLSPISEEDAKRWLEAYGTADEYEQAFGQPELA